MPSIDAAAARAAAPYLQALLVTFLWSTSWVLIKVGLADELPPLTFAGLRYTSAAALLVVAVVASPRRRAELAATSPATRRAIVALGVVMYAITQGAQFVGLSLLPAATLSLLLSFTPALVTVVAGPVLGEPARPRQWAGMGLAVAGAAIYLTGDLGVSSPVGFTVGLVGLAANAGAALLGRHVNCIAGLSPLTVTAPSMAIGGALTLATGLLVDGVPTVSSSGWAIIGWLAVVNTAFAFTLWNHTLRSLTATESAAINNTMLVQIAVLAAISLDEPLTVAQWAALALVSTGIWFTRSRNGHRRGHPAAPEKPSTTREGNQQAQRQAP